MNVFSLKIAELHLVNRIAWYVSRGMQLVVLACHTHLLALPPGPLGGGDWFTQVGVAKLWSECRIWTLTRQQRQRCAVHRNTWQNAKVAPSSRRRRSRRRWWWWSCCCCCLIADYFCCCCCLVAFAGTERNGKWQFPSSCGWCCCNSNLLHEEAACQTVIALIERNVSRSPANGSRHSSSSSSNSCTRCIVASWGQLGATRAAAARGSKLQGQLVLVVGGNSELSTSILD